MSDGLFRQEAIDAQRMDWVGPLHITGSGLAKIYALASLVIVALAFVGACLATYTDAVDVPGAVTYSYPPEALLSSVRGRITFVGARPGDQVEAGQVLARIVPTTQADFGTTIAVIANHSGTLLEGELVEGSLVEAGQRIFSVKLTGSHFTVLVPITHRLLAHVNPSQKFSVRLGGLSPTVQAPIVGSALSVAVNPHDKQNPYILAIDLPTDNVTIHGARFPISPGDQATVTIPLETQTIAGWVTTALSTPKD